MRVNRESLLRIAKETAIQRARADRAIIAVYLTGSLLSEDPFLGGAADIDLVFVHENEPAFRSEIIPLTGEVHLDITHRSRRVYDRPRRLRTDPWLGPEMWNPLLLHDSRHFFEFVQAGVRDRFHEPANVLHRARSNANHARQIWGGLQSSPDPSPTGLLHYLEAVNHAANAIAVLNGPPLAERRFLLQFPACAAAAGRPGLTAGLLGLLGAPQTDATSLSAFLSPWQAAFTEACSSPEALPPVFGSSAQPGGSDRGVESHLHPARLGYYALAIEFLLNSGEPLTILWPLLHTWTLSAVVLPPDSPQRHAWRSAFNQIGLLGDGFSACLNSLDQYLDSIEELLESMAAENGL